DYSIRVWLDPEKLAARNMTPIDVAAAVRGQNIDAAAGQVGQPPAPRRQHFQFPISALGRLTTPEQFGDIIVKAGGPSAPSAAMKPKSTGPRAPTIGILGSVPVSAAAMSAMTPSTAAPTGTGTPGMSASGSGTGGVKTAVGGGTTGGGASS